MRGRKLSGRVADSNVRARGCRRLVKCTSGVNSGERLAGCRYRRRGPKTVRSRWVSASRFFAILSARCRSATRSAVFLGTRNCAVSGRPLPQCLVESKLLRLSDVTVQSKGRGGPPSPKQHSPSGGQRVMKPFQRSRPPAVRIHCQPRDFTYRATRRMAKKRGLVSMLLADKRVGLQKKG